MYHILREFVIHLPPHQGPLPDIEMCLKQLKNIVLPPRPASEEYIDPNQTTSTKRGRDEIVHQSDWINAAAGNMDEDAHEEFGKPEGDTIRSDDIFRQRQRMRLLL